MREFDEDVQEVKEIMKDLDVNKAQGPDGVSNWIMKECSEQLAEVIHNTIICSFKEGKVPIDWKRANIVPVYKGGNKEETLNYRPVSLTSVVAKICERVVNSNSVGVVYLRHRLSPFPASTSYIYDATFMHTLTDLDVAI